MSVVKYVDLVSKGVSKVSAAVAVILTAGFLLSLLAQVFFRYALNDPLSWSEEIAMFLFVWAVLLLSSVGVREGFHIRLSFFIDSLPSDRWRSAMEGMIELTIAGFGIFVVEAGLRLVDLTWDNTSAATGYPVQYLYSVAPVCGALIVLHAVARLLNRLAGRETT
ncbi:TRAP transporter small permease [Microbaculum marinum]|uniref:TRAP transporter small permease protein n=1 Tax=Microbaculum marinum TaxID=1764581 RepID=A0AAW9RYK3_9HYPH